MIDYDLSHVPSEWLDVTLTPGPGSAIHQPVLALTITNGSRVLACVRDPETNPVHPWVLSSPTRRHRGQHLKTTATDLLRLKLLMTEDFVVARGMVSHGYSLIGTLNGQPVTYPLTMVNAHIETTYEFPSRTAAYSWIGWVDQEAFLKAVEERDVSLLGVEFEYPPVLYGLCTQSTYRMLRAIKEDQ